MTPTQKVQLLIRASRLYARKYYQPDYMFSHANTCKLDINHVLREFTHKIFITRKANDKLSIQTQFLDKYGYPLPKVVVGNPPQGVRSYINLPDGSSIIILLGNMRWLQKICKPAPQDL